MSIRTVLRAAALAWATPLVSCSRQSAVSSEPPDAGPGHYPVEQASFIVEVTPTDIRLDGIAVVPLPNRTAQMSGGVDLMFKLRGGARDYIVPLGDALKVRQPTTIAAQILADPFTQYRVLWEVFFTLGQSEHRFDLALTRDAGAAPAPSRIGVGVRARVKVFDPSVVATLSAGGRTRVEILSNGIDVSTPAGHLSRGCLQLGAGTTVPQVEGADDLVALADCLVRVKSATSDGTKVSEVFLVAPPAADAASVVAVMNAAKRSVAASVSFGFAEAGELVDVSILAIIANPNFFAGKRVRVMGYVKRDFEGNAIYLHKEDVDHALSFNAVELDLEGLRTRPATVSDRAQGYAIAEGIFMPSRHGRTPFSGTLSSVTRLDAWK